MNDIEKHGIGYVVLCPVTPNATSVRHSSSEKGDVKRLPKLFQELGRKSALACQDGSAGDPGVDSFGRQ
jgi:hypothetical protein